MTEEQKIAEAAIKSGFLVFMAMGVACVFVAVYMYANGTRYGKCTEMCRPSKFDSAQDVNGGCLCIGSDKVLRIRPAP